MKRHRRRGPPLSSPSQSKPSPKTPLTIGEWWKSAPSARVTRDELMRWAEGMYLVTRPDVIDMLRDYERLRRWRRTKAFFDIRRSPILKLFKGSMVEKRSFEDLDAVARARVREELDRVDQLPPSEEKSSA